MTNSKDLAACTVAQHHRDDKVSEARNMIKLLDNLMTTRHSELQLNLHELEGLHLIFNEIDDRLE